MSIVKLIRKRFSDRPIFTIYEIKKYTDEITRRLKNYQKTNFFSPPYSERMKMNFIMLQRNWPNMLMALK